MIFTAIRIASKVATVAWVAKTGIQVYKKGAGVYKTYKTVKGVTNGAKNLKNKMKK